jgi:putative Holliday junction resolvase
MTETIPASGRLAGIDYGTVRIGVAVCDADRILASPLETRQRGNAAADAEYFRRLVREERLVGFIVGLPVHGSGQESQKSLEARQFGQWLSQQTGLPVCFQDERYTSVFAERSLQDAGMTKKRRQQRLDKVAAQAILASWLESSGRRSPGDLGDR